MKSIRSWLVALLLVGAMVAVAGWHYRRVTRTAEYDRALAALKQEFLVEAAGLRALDSDAYRREVTVGFTGYFVGVEKLAKEYPELFDPARERARLDRQLQEGKLAEPQHALRVERLELAREIFKRMRNGNYRPLYSASDKGFRFDIYDVTPVASSNETVLKLSFVHWGIFGPVDYRSITGNMKATPSADGKPPSIPQITADGQPPVLHFNPEESLAEFPPGLEVGFYELPQLPRQAETMELVFDLSIRSVGGTPVDMHVVFPEIAIADGWKLPAGQDWEGQERVATDEELRAVGVQVPGNE